MDILATAVIKTWMSLSFYVTELQKEIIFSAVTGYPLIRGVSKDGHVCYGLNGL